MTGKVSAFAARGEESAAAAEERRCSLDGSFSVAGDNSAVIAVGDQLSSVSTCMVPVAAPNMKATMLSLVPDINTEQFIWEGTDDMCEHSTGDLLLKGVRGLPLFGSWLLTHSSQSAQALSEFDEPMPPGADWISDNAGISGFELQFFIMAFSAFEK